MTQSKRLTHSGLIYTILLIFLAASIFQSSNYGITIQPNNLFSLENDLQDEIKDKTFEIPIKGVPLVVRRSLYQRLEQP